MSDQTSDMRSKTEDVHFSEHSFGGMSGRISYERCRNTAKGRTCIRLLGIGCVLIVFGVFLTMCGILMYHVVQSNRTLYFPNSENSVTDLEASVTAKKEAKHEALETAPSENHLRNITAKMAGRYQLPEGVMVRDPEMLSNYLSTEILEGDIIVSFNGVKITDADKLYSMIMSVECCEAKRVVIFRNNEYHEFEAIIGH